MEDDGPIAGSRELWDAIAVRAGLDESGYDSDLVAELAAALSISSTNLRNDLSRHNVSVERLLLTFLTLIGPYTAMVRELLSFFARAGARATAENLRIEFDFGQESTPFDFDLKNFRDWDRKWRESMARLVVDRLDPVRAGELRHAFVRPGVTYTIMDGAWSGIVPEDPAVASWLRESAADPNVLRALPSVPEVANPELAAFLGRVWTLLLAVNEPALWEAQPPLSPDDVRAIVRGAYLLRAEAASLLPPLREVFGSVAQQTVEVHVILEQLSEIFNLPIWSRRSELYSVWAGARLIDVFADKARVHTVNRTLTFSFRGAHLATVRLADDSLLAIWCEVRTPASGLVGKGRVNAIQPDFLVMAEPTSHADSTVLVVECKQYRRQNSDNFAAALIDYSRNHRNAMVILVNYGPVTGAVMTRVAAADPLLLPRTLAIGGFRPGSARAIEEFEATVRGIIPHSTATADAAQPRTTPQGTAPSASTGAVRLSWRGEVDLDLHCWVVAHDGSVEHVDYRRKEWSGPAGRVWLEADIRSGGVAEALFWEGCDGVRLEIAVHAFTPGSSFSSIGALRVDLILCGITMTLEPSSPDEGAWWRLGACGPHPSAVQIWNVVQDAPPVAL
jgi:hypothetical protein